MPVKAEPAANGRKGESSALNQQQRQLIICPVSIAAKQHAVNQKKTQARLVCREALAARIVQLFPIVIRRRKKGVKESTKLLTTLPKKRLSVMKQTKKRPCTHRQTRVNKHPSASSSSHHKQNPTELKSTQSASGSRKASVIDSLQNPQNQIETRRSETVNLSQKRSHKLNCVSHLPDHGLQSFIRSQHCVSSSAFTESHLKPE